MIGLSCDSEMVRPNPVDDDKKAQVQVEETTGQSEPEPLEYTREEVWVCYNPGTEMHNQECIEETYPDLMHFCRCSNSKLVKLGSCKLIFFFPTTFLIACNTFFSSLICIKF